jgi:aspartate/glutamate racemase
VTSERPRIALVHAVGVAMQPVSDALAQLWPEARAQHLLDDALSPDREASSELTPALFDRIVALARYAHASGANGILYTCSAFGPAIDAAKRALPIPVLKPNEAMFDDALLRGRRVGMLATFAPSVPSMETEFAAMAQERNVDATLRSVCVAGAMHALREGRVDEHNRLLADAAGAFADCDVLLLAHFSTSRAFDAVRARVAQPVLTSPRSAVLALRKALEPSA